MLPFPYKKIEDAERYFFFGLRGTIMAEKIVVLNHVNKHYGGVHALKDVNFDLIRGEVHCLIGQNGCGKSTMIKTISGIVAPDAGSEVILQGKKLTGASPKTAMDCGIRVIYQDLSLFPNLTVAENITFDRHTDKTIRGVSWKEINARARQILDTMKISLLCDALVEELSIADRQLVAIARALATNAQLIIMDEPTSSLTRREVNVMFSIIRELREKGITILFVSHKLDEIVEIADRITVMRDGCIISTFDNNGSVSEAELAKQLSGQSIEYKQNFLPARGEIVLDVQDLSCGKQYQHVSFQLRKGEILGIIGLLGSGRTELATSLFGMNRPDSGKILLHGAELQLHSNGEAIRNKIAYVPEDRLLQGLVLDQSVQANTTVSILQKLKTRLGLLDKRRSREITERWIDELKIKSACPDINASAMSGGNQQKIVISKWLSTKPDVLILDQPTNGIDIAAKSAIYDLIRTLAEQGMSILLISDEVPEIYYNCPRALIMHHGRIVKELDCTAVSEAEFGREVLNVE